MIIVYHRQSPDYRGLQDPAVPIPATAESHAFEPIAYFDTVDRQLVWESCQQSPRYPGAREQFRGARPLSRGDAISICTFRELFIYGVGNDGFLEVPLAPDNYDRSEWFARHWKIKHDLYEGYQTRLREVGRTYLPDPDLDRFTQELP